MTRLTLKGASASHSPGQWQHEDYDFLADGKVVGRILEEGSRFGPPKLRQFQSVTAIVPAFPTSRAATLDEAKEAREKAAAQQHQTFRGGKISRADLQLQRRVAESTLSHFQTYAQSLGRRGRSDAEEVLDASSNDGLCSERHVQSPAQRREPSATP